MGFVLGVLAICAGAVFAKYAITLIVSGMALILGAIGLAKKG